MLNSYKDVFRYVTLVAVAVLPSRMFALREIHTVTAPDILLSHAVSNVPTKAPLDLRYNTISTLQSLTGDFTLILQNFASVCGFMVILASLFQYFRYRENPSAMRFATVFTTFFCGVLLIGVSYLSSDLRL